MSAVEMEKLEEIEKEQTLLESPEISEPNQGETPNHKNLVAKKGSVIGMISIDKLTHHPDSPRINPEKGIEPLVASIRQDGILHELKVTKPIGQQGIRYIVDGNRRLEAAKRLGFTELPCVVVNSKDDKEIVRLAFIINEQRKSYTPIERATYYKKAQEKFGYTLRELELDSPDRAPTISNCIKLLTLPPKVQE